ncbi:Rib/alpha-like domain-containing protein [Streptococcus mitis]|uniref:C protein alpha-antigen n=1 Tax=Streptococcus mitis TaxID=28037 RepID=A0A428H5H6_STRMT|nr:Rib/alpha-like domain-containing protein [Streptococcus mitis]RSJ91010.1 C protein alpha-antigen precursor [Streptococcus mitis]
MYSRIKKYHGQKVQRFSIRKYSFGAASVAIAALMMFGGGATAKADTIQGNDARTSSNLSNQQSSPSQENLNHEENVASSDAKGKEIPSKDPVSKPVVTSAEALVNEDRVAPENIAKVDFSKLSEAISRIQSAIDKVEISNKTSKTIEDAKAALLEAQALSANDKATQAEVDKTVARLGEKAFVIESMPKVSPAVEDKSETEAKVEKTNKNQDPRNGKAIPGKGESGFRATPTGVGEQAAEGPTSNNKRGVGANPVDNVISSLKNQFGDIDFNTPDVETKSATVENQYSRNSTSSPNPAPVKLGKITYNWKEKRIENEIDGWKIEGTNNYVTAIKPEAPTEVAADRPAGFDPKPSKVYDNNGSIDRQYNDTPVPGNPLAPNKANQNYANGVNYSSVPGVPLNNAAHSAVGKDYYIQLNKKGTQISKEFNVNPNSRLYLSVLTGGAYGNMGTAGTGEKVEITVRDADTGEVLTTLKDANNNSETTHVSTPYGDGGNGNGFGFWRTIINTPNTTKKIKITIKALEDGPAFKKTYPVNGKSEIEDGYFVGGVNLAVGAALEMTTDVVRNKATSSYGEDTLYKDKESGQLRVTVKNVGGLPTYGAYEYTIKIPEGVELKDSLKKANEWNWPGPFQVVSYDEATRTLRLKFNAGDSDPAKNGTRTFGIDFTTAKNFKGTATFKVTAEIKEGFTDLQGNRVLENTGVVNPNSPYRNTFNALGNTDNPDYYYNKTIYIDTIKPVTPTVEPVHTDSINGEKTDKNQPTELLISVPTEKDTNLTDVPREKQDIADNDRNNGTDRDADTEVDNIKEAIGGVTSMKVTLPNSKTPITLNKKEDGWYIGETKVEVRDGKLVVPVPKGTDLTEANETTNPDKRIKVTVLDKAGNESDPAYANVINEAPTVAVEKKDLYVYKTKEADKWNNDKVLEKAKPSATDLEDDRDGVDSTKPTIAVSDAGNLDTTKVGDYTVKVQSTDSEGKKSTETNVTVHVLDLIKVDPTVTTDPTNPSTTAPVSPKTADTPVKEGDENLGKYPAGVTREDLVKEVTRTIKYLKEEDANKDNATPLYAEKVQKVTYKRTATVNPETKEVTYSDWEVYNEADKLTDAKADGTNGKYNSVESPVINNYLLVDNADKLVPEKDAPKPAQNGTATSEVKKVLYKEIGSFVPNYPAGKKPQGAPDKISYPNNPTDPTVPGDFSTITIPYVPGYTPVYNGQELTPKNPNDPTQGYKVPDGFTPTDKFGESPITYTPSTQTAKVVIEKKVDGAANEVVSSFDLTGKSGSELPASTDVENKIKELKNQGYEVESDEYHIQDNHHPIFDDKEDINPTDGSSAPSQTFKIVVKPRIIEVPSSTPHEKDSPVDPNGDTPELKWPEGLAESDLNTTAKRVISYVKKDSDTSAEEKVKDDTVQTVPFTRKATVNLVTKEVSYTDWESPNKTWDKVGVDVLPGYIADKKEIPAKEAATPAKDTKVIPDETDKVTYTKIGSWIPVDPTTGKDGDPIPFPNDPNDPTKTGEITQIIPHKDGYTPKDGNGTPLEPVNPAKPEEGYKPPKITDPKANIKITYEKDNQKAKVKFVSVDDKGVETPLDTKYNIDDLTGKSGDKIPEEKVQARVDVLKSMGYDVVDNPFDQDPTFDTKKEIDQEFTIKVKPQVSTAKPVYVVERDKPSSEKLKDAVTTKGNEKTVDETKLPDTTDKVGDDTLTAPVTVTYGSGDNKREETVNVPIKVVAGYPQIVPVDPKEAPKAEDSINPDDYPAGSKFTYEKEPDTTTPGDKGVKVIVTDENGNELVRVPATVRVVDSTPQFVVADKSKPQPDAKSSITPEEYPEGTTFEYKEPIDTTTAGEKDVVVVAKLDGDTLVEVPAKVVVVSPETQYVFEDPAKPQPDASESINPEQYPEGTTFEYKEPVDTTTPGDKKVTVVAKNGEDKLVEVPAVVKVLPVVKPTGVTVLKDSTDLETMVKAKAQEVVDALPKDSIPAGVTVTVKEVKEKPETTATGEQKPAKVVIEYTDDKGRVVGSKEVEVPVTVVGSTSKSLVVFEGDTVEAKTVQDAVTPGANGTKGNPVIPEDLTKTTGKKEVTVPVTYDGIKDPEQVKVPVTVLPVAKGEVTVPKGETTDKVKEVAKAKAEEVANSADFKAKLPDGAKDVEVGAITEEVLATITSEAGTNKGTVKVPVTYTVDGVKYTKDAEITVNVVGSNADQVYVVEGDKPEIAKVKDAVTPGQGGTVQDPTEADLPDTKDKVGATDVTVPTKVKYANGEETVKVPVTVLPKVTPEGVTVLKDSDKQELEKAIKEQAEKAANNVKGLPSGVTVTVTEVKTGTVPPTATVGVQIPATVVVEYVKDGKVVATKEVPVPVNVVEVVPVSIETPVTSTPLTPEDYTKGIKIPEGGKVTNVENIPDLTTPGKKDPVKVTVELPNGKVVTVEVPVTVTPVKEIETPVTSTPLTPEDYTKGIKIPEGGKVTNVENIPDLTTPGKKDPVKVTVELPNGKVITVEVPVTVTPVKEIETPVTSTPLTPEDYTKGIKIPEGGKVTNIENIPDLTTPGKKDPVKVTIELPNGKVITVEVPVTVTPVKEIETPVTKTPLTPEDYTKGIKIPEGGKVTNVENIPDLTTPGKKDPVKVTVELPNGKVITVEVPVNVTPVKEIETPVTKTPLTPEDYTKGIKIPEGGKVTNVENIPDLTTPGKKDPVKVTVELPNGKVVTVEVPVNVTPVKEIETPVTSTPLTPEDYTKGIKIPEGGKVTNVENIPDLTTPGKKDPVKVTVELPNGKVITVEVPVNVTPVKEIETPVTKTPLTPEDYTKGIKIPEGGKVTNVENIPDLTTPGKKDPVKVTVELPSGKVITVEVPVNVTPVKEIETPVTKTPLTPEDYTKGIKIPEGGKVTNVENIPDLTTPGKKDPVKVTVELPNGKVITVEVPVNVTPVKEIETPVTSTPLTPEDYTKGIKIPEGGKVTNVENIPDLTTPGKKDPVKVTVELPNGKVIVVEVPVTVTPKATPAPRETVKTTPIVVEVGTPIGKDDVKKHVELPKGAEIVEVGEIPATDTAGQKPSVKVKVKLPSGEIVEVEVPVTVIPKHVEPSTPNQPASQPSTPKNVEVQKELPNTGTEADSSLAALGLLGVLSGFGLVARKKKED